MHLHLPGVLASALESTRETYLAGQTPNILFVAQQPASPVQAPLFGAAP